MTIGEILLIGYLGVCLVYWLYTTYGVVRTRRALRALEEPHGDDPAAWPKLSVVVAACNEADKIEPAARTLLDQDYPELEIILVDDRSTDGTSGIIDRLAREDGRVRPVHVTELPEGWIGKVHALECGYRESTGELVLFTDADVHFQPGTLRRAAAYLVREHLDHLTVFPRLWRTGVVVDAMIAVFLRHFILMTRLWGMRRGPLRCCVGVGAFNMVRRSAFEKTEGFAWMRMETADDYALAYMMKRSGAACDVVTGFESVGLYWYRSVREAATGAEKGYSSAFRCSLVIALLSSVLMLAVELSPVASLVVMVFGSLGAAWGVAAANVLLFVLSGILLSRWAGVSVRPLILAPLAAPVLAVLTVRVGVLGYRRGGVVWRGTLYASEELRKGRRIPIP
ncbi:MAG TPA: glycosyltransferase [Planctomycetota bacterium]|nr:glycosyltransferase [Planctomycetota bacterium]